MSSQYINGIYGSPGSIIRDPVTGRTFLVTGEPQVVSSTGPAMPIYGRQSGIVLGRPSGVVIGGGPSGVVIGGRPGFIIPGARFF
jgi:hypothetical protein